jgi:putative transposase
MHEYLGGIIRHAGGFSHAVGGVGDHVHVLVALRATHCLADLMRELKSESSRWFHEEFRSRAFAWQEGYGAFTVSASQVEKAKAYVLGQEKHHRQKTFQEEYLAMLKRGLVEYDERHLW